MKTVILAGGRGSRLAEETGGGMLPKPMVPVGEKPILEHICAIYARQGHKQFVIAAGYQAQVIRGWQWSLGDIGWETVVEDTGLATGTGGRLKRLAKHLTETFFLTYGDGLADIDLARLLTFHRAMGSPPVTMTLARPPLRFGHVSLVENWVTEFGEKTQGDEGWINAGFYVVEPVVLDLIAGDKTRFEYDVLPRLAAQVALAGYRHYGFFQCMDTWRDRALLEDLWRTGEPPWKRRAE